MDPFQYMYVQKHAEFLKSVTVARHSLHLFTYELKWS